MERLRQLGMNIYVLSKQNNISVGDLAAALNTSEYRINKSFYGRVLYSYPELETVSKVLNTDVHYLLNAELNDDSLTNYREYGKFTNKDNKNKILDIIEDVIRLKESLSQH